MDDPEPPEPPFCERVDYRVAAPELARVGRGDRHTWLDIAGWLGIPGRCGRRRPHPLRARFGRDPILESRCDLPPAPPREQENEPAEEEDAQAEGEGGGKVGPGGGL